MTWIVPVLILVPIGLTLFLRRKLGRAVQCPTTNRLTGKVVVITGASSGIGRATAKECIKRGAYVIFACRNEAKCRQVMTDIHTDTGCDANNLTFAYLDLAELSSVRRFAEKMAEERPVDILINNAGYLGPKKNTSEGMDQTFAVNYLGHFLLTLSIMKMRQNFPKEDLQSPLRVINLTSDSFQIATLDLNDVMSEKVADIYQIYGRSKLASLLFSRELARRYDVCDVLSASVHPGAVCTGLQRNWPGIFGYALRFGAKILFRGPVDGSQTTIYCACAPSDVMVKMNGQLVYDCAVTPTSHPEDNHDVPKKLWDMSMKLSGLDDGN